LFPCILYSYIYFQETLRVKDEELSQLAKDVRARDSTINELAQKLIETANAAQGAAAAAKTLDGQRHILFAEIELIKRDAEKQIQFSLLKVRIVVADLLLV
jgi:peptide deformylase